MRYIDGDKFTATREINRVIKKFLLELFGRVMLQKYILLNIIHLLHAHFFLPSYYIKIYYGTFDQFHK